ncbi:hypothetical protein [Chitinimonas sp. BJYL2]|uniref:hypothetical protein n=1 Tax=Chitinimonas sp. BJYL2 TaxID=2976696 RepID=UPI0022B4FA1F|nr:hypothetical protein [Chitinimonas sp. BJYL2]
MKPSTDLGLEPALVLGLVALFGVAMLAELERHGEPAQAQDAAQREAVAQGHNADTTRAPRPRPQSNSPS